MFKINSARINLRKHFNRNNFCNSLKEIGERLNIKTKSERKSKYDYVEIKFGTEARNIITGGIKDMANTVGKTFGPLGRNVAIGEGDNPIIVTKDGVTVAKYIQLTSRRRNLGCRLVKQVSGSTNIHAGDGTTTSTILAAEIVKIGNKMIEIGFHPMDVKAGVELAAKTLIDYLERVKVKITTKEQLFNLAMISSNQNTEISDVVTSGLDAVGINSVMYIEESQIGTTMLSVQDGLVVPHGYASPEYAPGEEISFHNALILVVREPITEIQHLIKTIEFAKSIDRSVIIFSPEIKAEPLSVLLYNKKNAGLNFIAVNVPDYVSDGGNIATLEDICIATGAQLCSLDDITSTDSVEYLFIEDKFGLASKCQIDELNTLLIGVQGDKKDIQSRIEALICLSNSEPNPGYKSVLQERITRMRGKHATIFVGGMTPVEVAETRDKIVDCLNSCKSGVEYGVVAGGGTVFIHALKEIEKIKHKNNQPNVGVNVFYQAIENTIKALYINSDTIADISIQKVKDKDSPYYGYDLRTDKFYSNMIEMGIIDSFNTIKTAVEDAVSVGSLIISTECIVFKEVDYDPPPLDAFRSRLRFDNKFKEEYEAKYKNQPDKLEDLKQMQSII